MNQVIQPLKNLLNKSGLSYEEVQAFCAGIESLAKDEQILLYRVLNHDVTMIYPHYIHFMAKINSKRDNKTWEEAVEDEIKFLEDKLNKRKVGSEVK
jgi:hypothetical protein